jgi:hypothetical protein
MQLCSKNFQRHIPFLHAPSFGMTSTPLILVLGMFVVGASYSNIVRPQGYIFAMAMRVLSHVQEQQVSSSVSAQGNLSRVADRDHKHEINMSEPPLTSLQAAIAASAVLGSSQNEIAHKAVRLQFARNISVRSPSVFYQS